MISEISNSTLQQAVKAVEDDRCSEYGQVGSN